MVVAGPIDSLGGHPSRRPFLAVLTEAEHRCFHEAEEDGGPEGRRAQQAGLQGEAGEGFFAVHHDHMTIR